MRRWRKRASSSQHPEWWGKLPEPIPYEIHWREEWPAPWREVDPNAILVPRQKLCVLAKPRRMNEIRRDSERLALIEASMREQGVLQPLIVVVDPFGKISLLDGHHRLIVSERIGMDALPVVIRRGERIRGWGQNVSAVLAVLLQSEKPSCLRP